MDINSTRTGQGCFSERVGVDIWDSNPKYLAALSPK